MTAPKPISKTNASFPKYLSFQNLRERGIAHCQALSSDLWTDFNLHDPGLTILETLCYALTDLGYRTNFPIEDLLARRPEQKILDKAACGKLFDDNFFTPEQILTCNPVTMLDLRKLLIDIPGVKNAWFERADAAEVKLYLNEKTAALQYEVPEDLVGDDAGIAKAIVKPDGLYVVCLELDGDTEQDACAVESVPVDRILKDVWTLLHSHRNLCEDFIDVIILGDEEIALCTDIEIDTTANPEDVLLAMYQKLETFLSPTLSFYTLQEMLARGKSIEEIYAGRPLTPLAILSEDNEKAVCSHGFIDTDELSSTEQQTQLHTSDLYKVIMDVPGVLAVRKLLAVNYVNGFAKTRGEKWCLHLTSKHHQRFDLKRSQIQFFKGLLPFSVDKETVAQRYKEERNARTKAPLEAYQLDQPVPEGIYRDLQDYRSTVHELPLVYAIGEGGLPESATEHRKAQVRQLRAYLLFYDQILANYLAQLANLRELFSFCPDNERSANRTYFTQLLGDIPQIEELLKNYNQCDVEKGYPPVPENYPDYLGYLVESQETYSERRNRFLDHLLARFAESFTDYVLLMFDVNGNRNGEDQIDRDKRIIRDKTGFLSTYPETSRNRGKGFNYTDSPVWNTNNVSGLEKRVARLLGFGSPDCQSTELLKTRVGEPFSRRSLSHTRVVEVDGAWYWKIELPGFAGAGDANLTSRHGFASKSEAHAALDEFRELTRDERNLRRLTYENFRHFGFGILAPEENNNQPSLLAEHQRFYPPHSESTLDKLREEAIEKIRAYFVEHTTTEGNPVSTKRYEIVTMHKGELNYFTVTAFPTDLPPSVFTGSVGYISEDLAREAAETLIEQAATESAYQLFTRDGFDHHGFAVVGPDEVVLAEVDQPWSDPDDRDLYLYQLKQLAIGGNVGCELDQETECYFYQLLDAQREHVFFGGVSGYPTVAEAITAFELEFLPRACDPGNYRDLDGASEFGFELLAGPGEQVLATHPQRYQTAAERLLRKLAIIYYLKQPEIRTKIDGEPGRFGFELRDMSGEVLLESTVIYSTEGQANTGYRGLLELAHQRTSYCLIDDQDNELPYGFGLVGKDGELLARHPKTYKTTLARDLAIGFLVRLFCPVEDVRYELQYQEDAYAFALLAEDGMELLVSAKTYASKDEAQDAFRLLLDMARQPEQYVLISDDGAYGFVLHDVTNEVLAIHTASYAHAEERDLALRGIVSYVCPASVSYSIDGEPGCFHYFLFDPENRELFRSIETYLEEALARAGLEEFLDLAIERRRYCPIGEEGAFGFELLGDEGAVAEHSERYATIEEREAAIVMIIAYLSRIEPERRIENPTGAFRFELRDEGGDVTLVGTKVLSSIESAKAAYREARALARDRQHYRRTDAGPGGCPFGYEILDDVDVVVAEDPRHYASIHERDAAIKRLYGLMHDGSTIPNVVWPEYENGFKLADHTGKVLLESINTYQTSVQADEASEILCSLAAAADNYAEVDGTEVFSFQLRYGECSLARPPSPFATERERDAAILATRFTAFSRGAPFAIASVDECLFVFQYLNTDAEIALIGTETAADEAGALELLLISYARAIERDAYVFENDKNGYGFRLVAADRSTLAEHPKRYASAEDRNEALQEWLECLVSFALKPMVVKVPVRFYYQLVGFEGDALLRSVEYWQSAEEAEEAFRSVFVPLAQSESNYELIYDNKHCTYTFQLREPPNDTTSCVSSKGAVLAIHGHSYELPRLRDEQMQFAIDLVRTQTRNANFPGIACGHFFRLMGDDNELVSISYYPDAAQAASACTLILPRLATLEAYVIEALDEGLYRLVVSSEDGLHQACSGSEEYDALVAMRDALLASATQEVELTHQIEKKPSEFHYRLTDASDETLLESAQGHSAEVWAYMDGFERSGPRDEAISRTRNYFTHTERPLVRIEEIDGDYYFFFDVDAGLVLCSRRSYASHEVASLEAEKFLALPNIEENYSSLDLGSREYAFEIFNKQTVIKIGDKVYTANAQKNHEQACDACNQFVERAQATDAFRLITGSEDCAFGFELVAEDRQTLARYPHLFATAEERDEIIRAIQCLVDMEGLHLVEHILLRPNGASIDSANTSTLPDAQSGLHPDALIPLGRGCRDTDGNLCSIRSDPYSFRVTVVAPYWPRRFRHPDFRPYFERTLRLETPAHIFPRICWVDVCQMQEFEDAYRRWLHAIGHPVHDCDRAAAQNALVDILFNLKSVYSTAQLFGCTSEGATNPIRLDQSILGTAGEDHGDTS